MMIRLEIAHISELSIGDHLTEDDSRYVDSCCSQKRKKEIVAWRTLLRRTLQDLGMVEESKLPIIYNTVGAPSLDGSPLHFGVSHSSHMVAIIIADAPCGVDIEFGGREFEFVAPRFVTQGEERLFEGWDRNRALATIWSTKEALYKLSGCEGLDLLSDIEIEGVEEDFIVGRVLEQRHTLCHRWVEGHVVVYSPC